MSFVCIHLVFLVSNLSIVQDLGQSEVSNNGGFCPFDRQVGHMFAALLKDYF